MAGQQLPDDLVSWLRDLERRLVALERSPQLTSASIKDGALTIYDANGKPIVVLGKQADGRYGMSVNNAGGTAVARLGEQSTGRYGLSTFDAAGNRIVELGELSGARQGLEAFSPTGVLRAGLGQLADGTYDLASYDAAGANPVKLSTLAFGPALDIVTANESTTSTVDADLATVGPTVTATVGPSGKVVAVFSAITTVAATNASSVLGISVDGGAMGPSTGFSHNFTAGSGGGGVAAVRSITGLSPGVHTFRLKYKSSNGTSVSFQNRSLLVLPF